MHNDNPIYQQARDRTAYLLRAQRADARDRYGRGVEASLPCGIEVWTGPNGSQRFEIQLSGGGPSDGINIDEADRVTYWTTDTPHSETATIQLPDSVGDYWLSLVESDRYQ
jgi:hypothetical protein